MPITLNGVEFLLGGDIITEIDGQPLNGEEKFVKLVQSLKVGDKIHLTLYREKKIEKVEFSLTERPILPTDLHLR